MAIVSLAIVAAGCGGSSTPEEGLAITDASTAESTTATDDGEQTDTGDVGETASVDTDADGSAPDGELTSPSQRLTYDLNYDVPERLEIGLEFEELKNLLIDVHGPTDDLATEMNRVALFPESFPTMAGSDIYDYTVQSLRQPNAEPRQTVKVRFFVPAEAGEVAETYEAALIAPDYEVTRTADETQDDLMIRTVEYDVPSTPIDGSAGAALNVISGDFDGTIVDFEIKTTLSPGEAALVLDNMVAAAAWFDGTPIPPDGDPRSTFIQSSINPYNFLGGAHWLGVDGAWNYPDLPGTELAAQAIDAVESSNYDFTVAEGEPSPDEALQAALDADDGYVGLPLDRDGDEFSGERLTIWSLAEWTGTQQVPYLELSGGNIDLYDEP